jgi:hypothetical protein
MTYKVHENGYKYKNIVNNNNINNKNNNKEWQDVFTESFHIGKVINNEITTDDPKILIKIYNNLKIAYDLRNNFRIKAIHPTAWDNNHTFYMNEILNKMKTCLNRLTIMFNTQIVNDENIEIYVESEDKPKKPKIVSIPKMCKDETKYIEDIDAEIEKYTKIRGQEINTKTEQFLNQFKMLICNALKLGEVQSTEHTRDITYFALWLLNYVDDIIRTVHEIAKVDIIENSPLLRLTWVNDTFIYERDEDTLIYIFKNKKRIMSYQPDLIQYLYQIYLENKDKKVAYYRWYRSSEYLSVITFISMNEPKIIYINSNHCSKCSINFNYMDWIKVSSPKDAITFRTICKPISSKNTRKYTDPYKQWNLHLCCSYVCSGINEKVLRVYKQILFLSNFENIEIDNRFYEYTISIVPKFKDVLKPRVHALTIEHQLI